MKYVYLDWNVFNKVEKINDMGSPEREVYTHLRELILQKQFTVPYSNAHINDLLRGYHKNSDYIDKHLQTLAELTGNLCVAQYWGEPTTRWHRRNPKDFFYSALEEGDTVADSFSSLFDYFEDDPLIRNAWELQKAILKKQTVDQEFKKIYAADPFFNLMFPKTKVEMNVLALCEDIYNFSNRIKSDYNLYKNYRKFLNQLRAKLPQYQNLYNAAQNKFLVTPKYLTWDEMWEEANPKVQTTKNNPYDKILNLFTTTDLKGYRQDEKFANLIDDALHCFYGAHCNYFLTIDGRCFDKSQKVYEELKISTIVLKPEEFIELASS